jgi:hypothetical protein
MFEDAQDRVKLEVRYVDVKTRAWLTVNPTDTLDELKTLLDDFFIHIGSNHRTRDVIVNVPGVDLGENKKRTFGRPCIIHNFSKMIVTLITCLG